MAKRPGQESQSFGAEDVGSVDEVLNAQDPFEQAVPIAGLEHLGAAIVDAQGQPSGSPANYEQLRGVSGVQEAREPDADTVAAIAAEFPGV